MVLTSFRILRQAGIGLKALAESADKAMHGMMIGKHPVVQTSKYLEQGIIFRDCVKIVAIHYGNYENNHDEHEGLRNLVELNFAQFQYKNPNVQVLVIKDLLPSPFLTFFLDNDERFHIDAAGKSQIEILTHIQKVIGKPKALIEMETRAVEDNPANFGPNFKRKCLCEVEGQVPCPSTDHLLAFDDRKLFAGKFNKLNKHWTDEEEDEY